MSQRKTKHWTSCGLPHSLISIGTEALATHNNDIIGFFDLQDKVSSSFNANRIEKGCGVSVIAGHNMLPIFAFAEQTLRPNIRVLNYPSCSVISIFESPGVTGYKDLCFSTGDLLIALTTYPNHTIRVLNFQKNVILVELNTFIDCNEGSLLCSNSYFPTICQFSQVDRKLFFYDLCYHSDGYSLLELSTISTEADQNYSSAYNKCFADDNTLYMVNDYGDILSAETGLFFLKVRWVMPHERQSLGERPKPRSYILRNGRRGFLIANTETIHFVRHLGNDWVLEFKILDIMFPILKIVSDVNGDLYMADSKSNLYYLDVVEAKGSLVPLKTDSFKVKDFAVLRGIREETILTLTDEHQVLLINLLDKKKWSDIKIEGIELLCSHNSKSYAVVGNKKGQLHFLSYADIRAPSLLGSLDLETTRIKTIKILNEIIAVLDVHETIIIVNANFDKNFFYTVVSIDKPIQDMSIIDFFVINSSQVLVLYSLKVDVYWPQANQMCIYDWTCKPDCLVVRHYDLPQNYVSFAVSIAEENKIVELFAARAMDVIIDVFTMDLSVHTWTYTDSFRTEHRSSVLSIKVSRHLVSSSLSDTIISYRTHSKSKKPFGVAKLLDLKFLPEFPRLVEECFLGKYLIKLHQNDSLQIIILPDSSLDLKENTTLPIPDESRNLLMSSTTEHALAVNKSAEKVEPTASELAQQERLRERIARLNQEVTELIDYDLSVAGMSKGMFRKFCLNIEWLEKLSEQAKQLCKVESESIVEATQEQSRVRDWIYRLIFTNTQKLSSMLRALFTNVKCENYNILMDDPAIKKNFDLFRVHDLEPPDEELLEMLRESNADNETEEVPEEDRPKKTRQLYEVSGDNILEHIMAEELALQSKYEISYFQMHNTCYKFDHNLRNPIKNEFGKYFDETVQLKQQIMVNIMATNDTLYKIYSNMNIMRRLLNMEQIPLPKLSVPTWAMDENIERILTVDDSEIKAINRRKKKAEQQQLKSGRMLLWALEFWHRALLVMMDGVLEKLWEEEIKKDIMVPEFVSKKEPHEYNITEQKQYREYLEKVRILEEDRRKYLTILASDEDKAQFNKKSLILKINEKISQLSILKLKYDFWLRHCSLQLINTKIVHLKRIQYVLTLDMLYKDYANILETTNKYSKVCTYYGKSVLDVAQKVETWQNRDRLNERNFRTNFLNAISAQLIPEFRKLYKKCPKLNKNLLSAIMCDLLRRILQHQVVQQFPIPLSALEYMKAVDELDNAKHMPHELEPKYWEHFVKLRRQNIINSLTVKHWALNHHEVQNTYKRHLNNLNELKTVRHLCLETMEGTRKEYRDLLKNRSLVLTLDMGQFEVNFSPTTRGSKNSILMHVNDVMEVNAKIKEVGLKKLRAMEKVAFFRRQVISKEWEHEVTKANISYLKFMLDTIEKSKVSKEFLNILKDWDKNLSKKRSSQAAVGYIENEIESKITVANCRLDRCMQKIDETRVKVTEMKRKNKTINVTIDNLKVAHALNSVLLDNLADEKRSRDQHTRMEKIKARQRMLANVRADYARILELRTLLELQRLRTYPNLPPPPLECP